MATQKVVCVGDTGKDSGNHTGSVTSAGQTTVKVDGVLVAVVGGVYNCSHHGEVGMVAAATKTFVNGKLVITVAGRAADPCGATFEVPVGRSVRVE